MNIIRLIIISLNLLPINFGFGVSYTDIFAKAHIRNFGLKSIDLKFYQYDRDTSFSSSIITAGFKFVMD
jgi:hypothetical protein